MLFVRWGAIVTGPSEVFTMRGSAKSFSQYLSICSIIFKYVVFRDSSSINHSLNLDTWSSMVLMSVSSPLSFNPLLPSGIAMRSACRSLSNTWAFFAMPVTALFSSLSARTSSSNLLIWIKGLLSLALLRKWMPEMLCNRPWTLSNLR